MQPAIITGLAALTGAAIGGLVTVWATHLSNRAAAERERKQRLYEFRARRHADAVGYCAEFLSKWTYALVLASDESHDDDNEQRSALAELLTAGSNVILLLPNLEILAWEMMKQIMNDDSAVSENLDPGFMPAAREELKKLEPRVF